MKRERSAGTKAARRSATPARGISANGNPCSPEESQKKVRAQIDQAMPDIIAAIVREAKAGSCQHAKFLMEFAVEVPGHESPMAPVDPEEESLASILLRELRQSEAEAE